MAEREQEKVRVWPAEGVLIRDELTGQPLTAGQEVLRTRAIERAIQAGDLLRDEPGKADVKADAEPVEERQVGKDQRAARAPKLPHAGEER